MRQRHTHIATMLIAALTVAVVSEAEAQLTAAEVGRGKRAATSASRTDATAVSELRIDRESNRLVAADPAVLQQTPSPPPKPRDSVLNGVLIGAGVGALLGLIPDHYDDCEECHDSLYGSIAVGAGIGLIVDLLRHPKPAAPSARTDDPVRLHLIGGRGTVGLRGRLAWR